MKFSFSEEILSEDLRIGRYYDENEWRGAKRLPVLSIKLAEYGATLELLVNRKEIMRSFNKIHFQILSSLVAFICLFMERGFCIDCFKCVSFNGDNKPCDDPFHNNYSAAILESPCMGGRKGRAGLFPATACIKIAGYYDDTGETITVRGCALDSGTLTTDTEIIRMSHCGKFYYEDRYVHGCLQSCSDADACNSTTSKHKTLTLSWNIMMFSLVLYSLYGQQHYLHLLQHQSRHHHHHHHYHHHRHQHHQFKYNR